MFALSWISKDSHHDFLDVLMSGYSYVYYVLGHDVFDFRSSVCDLHGVLKLNFIFFTNNILLKKY